MNINDLSENPPGKDSLILFGLCLPYTYRFLCCNKDFFVLQGTVCQLLPLISGQVESYPKSPSLQLCHGTALFSSSSLGSTLKSVIHLELIFVLGNKHISNIILLHVDIKFPQHPLLKTL